MAEEKEKRTWPTYKALLKEKRNLLEALDRKSDEHDTFVEKVGDLLGSAVNDFTGCHMWPPESFLAIECTECNFRETCEEMVAYVRESP